MTTSLTYQDCFRLARAGQMAPGTVRIKLDGGVNSGRFAVLDGTIQMDRRGNIRLGALIEGIGTRYVSYFTVA